MNRPRAESHVLMSIHIMSGPAALGSSACWSFGGVLPGVRFSHGGVAHAWASDAPRLMPHGPHQSVSFKQGILLHTASHVTSQSRRITLT